MIISHAHRFILMAPWKTASSTCHATLEKYNESPYERFFHFQPLLNRVVHQHITLGDLGALPEGGLGYSICAFVRNPYDRAFSGFVQLQRDFAEQPSRDFEPKWVGDLVRAQISENMARIVAAGFDFDEWLSKLPDYEVFDVGRNTSMVLHPAHYWTHVNGERRAAFIGKVETFDQDFRELCEKIGIDEPRIVPANLSADRTGERQASESKYAERMSRRSLDRINELFADDFALFGYQLL